MEKGTWDFFAGNYEFSVDLFENFKSFTFILMNFSSTGLGRG